MTTDNILAPIAALSLPDAAGLTTRAQGVLEFIQSFEIVDDETYGFAAEELQSLKARAKKIEDQRTAITGPLNQAVRAVNDLFRGPAHLLESAEGAIKVKMLRYQEKVEAEAAERRRVAEAAAAAERQRVEAEAAARQAEAQAQHQAAAAAAAAGDTQAASLAQAAAQRAQDEATTAATSAQLITAPVVTIAPPKASGISTSTKVSFDVTSLRLLVAYIATGKVYEEGDPALAHPELLGLLAADSVRLRAYVRGLGMNCALPGVRVFEDKVLSARAA